METWKLSKAIKTASLKTYHVIMLECDTRRNSRTRKNMTQAPRLTSQIPCKLQLIPKARGRQREPEHGIQALFLTMNYGCRLDTKPNPGKVHINLPSVARSFQPKSPFSFISPSPRHNREKMANSTLARFVVEVAPPQFVSLMRHRTPQVLDTIREEEGDGMNTPSKPRSLSPSSSSPSPRSISSASVSASFTEKSKHLLYEVRQSRSFFENWKFRLIWSLDVFLNNERWGLARRTIYELYLDHRGGRIWRTSQWTRNSCNFCRMDIRCLYSL